MRVLIIRTCQRDWSLALGCYYSALEKKVCDTCIFFAEDSISGISIPYPAMITLRKFCDNFGGRSNVITMFEEFKKLPLFSDNDTIIFCDSDIVWNSCPSFEFDWAGWSHEGVIPMPDDTKIRHVSGQCQIFSGWLWNCIINSTQLEIEKAIAIGMKYEIADDIIISILANKYNPKFQIYDSKNVPWTHIKYYWLNNFVK